MKKRHIAGIIVLVILFTAAFMGILLYAKLNLINRVDLDSEQLKVSDIYRTDEDDTDSSEAYLTDEETEDDNPYTGFEIVALVGLDTRTASELANSDTMMFACINHDERTIRLFSLYRDTLLNIGNDSYKKANAAYCSGGAEKFLSMVNLNLDLNVTKFVTTNFNALAKTIDILDGLDIDMTREELIHMNNYNVETSEVCGVEYEAIPVPEDVSFDGARTRTFHLTGTQAVSYARIRYTEGWDYKRTERQRLVLMKIRDKVVTAGLPTILKICDAVFPLITTNLNNEEIISMVRYCVTYDIIGSTGFPFDKAGLDVDGMDAVVPVTLESNVIQLHEYIYPDTVYIPSNTVLTYSSVIQTKAEGGSVSQVIPEESPGSESEEIESENTGSDLSRSGNQQQVRDATAEEPDPQPTVEPEPQPTVEPEPQPAEPDPEPEPSEEPEPMPEPEPVETSPVEEPEL
ncbi:MAG: LCP family protein [Lachnospiraceae bacterium]|nr:LCP family protein [Lachnospiraceae bacterium]